MAGNKYLKNNSGTITEEAALQASTGVTDAGKIVALDSTGKLDNTMMPTGIGADTALIAATEAMAAGDFVNVYNSSGAKCRKADASTAGKEAHGFVLAAVDSGNNATVYFEGTNTQVTGHTPGVVFLSATPGLATSTAPSGSGNVVQRIGFATGATTINFQAQTPIVLV
jgi:hypothetical protein